MPKVVVLAELLLRLDPRPFMRLVQADTLGMSFTGAEANVAVNLSHWGISAGVVSKVPEHEMGQCVINNLRRYGLDTAHMLRGGERLGVFYVETGASQRSTNVVYDREHTSFQSLQRGELDWDAILSGADWFVFSGSGISRGANIVEIAHDARTAAKRLGVKVCCDINYRSKLWSLEAAREAFTGLMPSVDLAMSSLSDVRQMFDLDADSHEAAARQLHERFGCTRVVMGIREGDCSSSNRFGATMFDGTDCYTGRSYEIQIVDRIGTGDALTAGILYGLMSGYDLPRTVEFGIASGCLKHSIPRDFNLVSIAEVEELLASGGAGRVKR